MKIAYRTLTDVPYIFTRLSQPYFKPLIPLVEHRLRRNGYPDIEFVVFNRKNHAKMQRIYITGWDAPQLEYDATKTKPLKRLHNGMNPFQLCRYLQHTYIPFIAHPEMVLDFQSHVETVSGPNEITKYNNVVLYKKSIADRFIYPPLNAITEYLKHNIGTPQQFQLLNMLRENARVVESTRNGQEIERRAKTDTNDTPPSWRPATRRAKHRKKRRAATR